MLDFIVGFRLSIFEPGAYNNLDKLQTLCLDNDDPTNIDKNLQAIVWCSYQYCQDFRTLILTLHEYQKHFWLGTFEARFGAHTNVSKL